MPPRRLAALYGLALLTFPAGCFVTLLPAIKSDVPFSPMFVAGLVVFFEACLTFLITVKLDLLYSLPKLDKGLRAMEVNGHTTPARHSWTRRMTRLASLCSSDCRCRSLEC